MPAIEEFRNPGCQSESLCVLPAIIALTYLPLFPVPSHTQTHPPWSAAVLTEGSFSSLWSEKSMRVSGQKTLCHNVTNVTSVQPVLTNGNKSYGNYTAVSPGNYASHCECTVAGSLAILCNEIIQNQQIKNSLLTYSIIQTLPLTLVYHGVSHLLTATRHPLPLVTAGKRKCRASGSTSDPDPNPSRGGRPVIRLVAETCLGTTKKGNEPQERSVLWGILLRYAVTRLVSKASIPLYASLGWGFICIYVSSTCLKHCPKNQLMGDVCKHFPGQII